MDWIDSPLDVADRYDGFIFDVFGVLHDGRKANHEALSWLTALGTLGKEIALVSNSPLHGSQVAKGLEGFGIARDLYGHLLTAGMEARHVLGTYASQTPFYFVGTPEMEEALITPNLNRVETLSKAQFLVFAGPDPLVKNDDYYDDLLKEALARGIPLICANPDMGVFVGSTYALRAGFFAQRYEDMGGQVSYHGKPHPSIYMRLLAHWPPMTPERILCVGDSLVTDVVGAQCQGHASLLIVGQLCLDEMGLGSFGAAPSQDVREKISAQLAKGPYNPTYGLFLT